MATNVEFEVQVEDVEYSRIDGEPWLARIYRPRGAGTFPSIIDVHGGAWHNGDRTNNESIDRALAARGILVAAIDFRQPPQAGYPASVADVNLGVRWLKANAAKFNGTSAVGAFGNSSGGHLVVLAGIRPRDPRYAALPLPGRPDVDARMAYVIAGWPVIDPLYRFQYAQREGRQELVDAHIQYWGSEEAMAEGAPRTALDSGEQVDLLPMLFLLKEGDKNHPQPMQDEFIAAYKRRGGSIQVEMFSGLPERGMEATPEQPESMRAIETMVDFIRRHGS
jgi:acetyl esterase